MCYNSCLQFRQRITYHLSILLLFLVRMCIPVPTHYETLLLEEDFSIQAIKKNFKKLALAYHPDKLPKNLTDEERDEYKDVFLNLQEAYEILSDPEKRLVYDMTLQGGDLNPKKVVVQFDRYRLRPFQTYVRSPQLRLYFYMEFEKPKIEAVHSSAYVDLFAAFQGYKGNHTFYRRKICPDCGGNGGLAGACTICPMCMGEGVARHLYGNVQSEYQQMTETTCGKCRGKRCIPRGRCVTCGGNGLSLEEVSVDFEVPIGFENGIKISYANQGHSDTEGSRGDAELSVFYKVPSGIKVDFSNGNVEHVLEVSIDQVLDTFSETIQCPSGEMVEVYLDRSLTVEDILGGGVDLVKPGLGLIQQIIVADADEYIDRMYLDPAQEGEYQAVEYVRGDLIVHININWMSVNKETWLKLLKASGISPWDPTIRRLTALFLSQFDKEHSITKEQNILAYQNQYEARNYDSGSENWAKGDRPTGGDEEDSSGEDGLDFDDSNSSGDLHSAGAKRLSGVRHRKRDVYATGSEGISLV